MIDIHIDAAAPRTSRAAGVSCQISPKKPPIEASMHYHEESLSPGQAPSRASQKWVRAALLSLLAFPLIAVTYFYLPGIHSTSTDDPNSDTGKAAISTDVRGIVEADDADESQRVTAGKVLCRFDGPELHIAVMDANSHLAPTALTVRSMNRNASAC
jgi:multidrug resistance efflux pump